MLTAILALRSPLAGADCPPSLAVEPGSDAAFSVIKNSFDALQTLRTQDVAGFCRDTARIEADDDLAIYGFSSEAKAKAANLIDPWVASEHPDPALRLHGFLAHFDLANFHLNNLDAAEAYLKNPTPLSMSNLSSGHHADYNQFTIDKLEASDSYLSAKAKKLANLPEFEVACNTLVLGYSCGYALETATQLAAPADALYSYLPLYQDVVYDPKYDEGLRRAALKVLDHVKKDDAKGTDLFSDVQASFVEAGISPKDAVEMAWKTMGLIATGGPNVSWRLFDLKADPSADGKKVALSVISSLASVLDSGTFASGHPYSYPKSVHTTCNSGKTYHFWLTAYLAHDLAERGYDQSAAAAAAFTAQKGYEMFSDTTGRDPARPFEESYASPYSDWIRTDLAYSGAGAAFGAASVDKRRSDPKLDVDQGLRQILRASRPLPRLSEDEAEALVDSAGPAFYFGWRLLVGSDAAFGTYLRDSYNTH